MPRYYSCITSSDLFLLGRIKVEIVKKLPVKYEENRVGVAKRRKEKNGRRADVP